MFLLTVPAVVAGLGDGRRRQQVARGQNLPFGIVAVISVGIFPVCYLATYSVALRRSAAGAINASDER